MLAAHPNIYIKNEIPDARQAFTEAVPEAIIEHISEQVALTDIGNPLPTYLTNAEKTRWGLKDPLLTFCLPELADNFPTAKVIVMIRDGRAVSLSYMEQRWGAAANCYAGAQRWIEELKLQETFLSAHPNMALQVRYEDLLEDPSDVLCKICSFIGEPYTEKMLEYSKAYTEIRKHQGNENAFKPVDTSRAERWKGALSARQIEVFEAVAGVKLQECGYTLEGQKRHKLSWIERSIFSAHNAYFTWINRQLRWYSLKHQKNSESDLAPP